MIGATLGDIREYIESLATESGEYYLACARTGERPVPAADLYFRDRETARAAARATEQYRQTLRRYDPQLPCYDVIVCQRSTVRWGEAADGIACPPARPAGADDAADGQSPVEYCHTVASVLFETIASSPYDGVEDAVMETYFEAAEAIEHPDELCLQLLESMAAELDARLGVDDQARVLRAAASRLPTPADASDGDPLASTLADLEAVELLDRYAIEDCSIDLDADERVWTVRLDGYAPVDSDDRCVTLPLVVELFRRLSDRPLTVTPTGNLAEREPGAWRLTITTGGTVSDGLVCVTAGGRA